MLTEEKVKEIYYHVKKIVSQSLNGTVLTEQIVNYILSLLKEEDQCQSGK